MNHLDSQTTALSFIESQPPGLVSQSQLPHVHVLDRAATWSNSTLTETYKDRPVLHHLVEAAFDKRVYDKVAGTQKELYMKAATAVDVAVLQRITVKIRVETRTVERLPAELNWKSMKDIIEKELATFSASEEAAITATGIGGSVNSDEDEYQATLRHLLK